MLLWSATACSRGGGGPAIGELVQSGDAQLLATSPLPGEGGVAISRETIVRLTDEIDPGTVTPEAFHAEVAGARLPARIHVAADRKSVTLFYTDPNGLPPNSRVTVTLDGDRVRSANGRPADLDGDGRTGGALVLEFATLDLQVVPGTELCGRVLASDFVTGAPKAALPGVTISVDGLPGAATTTDRFGNFCLRGLPAGRIFVHIDGGTCSATPPGFYYPTVGKAWQTIGGQRSTVGTIHLPAILESGLTPVSNSTSTQVAIAQAQLATIPDPAMRQALSQVVVDVPAGSLFNGMTGARGGSVALAPVPSNRLPGTLPFGLALPVVVTVQVRGGTDFDRPVPVSFPNLAPSGGQPLPPGAKSALWSFNHDTGRFEVVGPMTVSQDGLTVTTDPGVGIRAPGWHGTQAGSGGQGQPPRTAGNDPCSPSFWDVTKTVYSTAGSLADCAKELLGVKAGLNCFLNAKSLLEAMVNQINTLVQLAKSGNLTPATAAQIAQELVAKKNAAIALVDCFEKVNPGATLNKVVVCTESALSILNQLCMLYENCTTIWGKDQACNLIALAQSLAAEAKGLLDIVDNYEKKALMVAFCKALEQGLGLLKQYLSLPRNPGPGLTPQQIQELENAFNAAAALVPQVTAIAGEFPRIEALPGSARSFAQQMTDVGSGIVDSAGTERQADVFYALRMESDPPTSPRRGRTSALGAFFEIVPANEAYTLVQYDPAANQLGMATGFSSGNGQTTHFHSTPLDDVTGMPDADGDGLVDAAEDVVATDPSNPDTDGDGVGDLQELQAGTNPLDGVGMAAGTAVEVDTPGRALDVCLADGVAVVADDDAGVSVFNVYAGLTPEWLAQVDLPAPARRVACSDGLALAAMGGGGAAVVDLRQLPASTVLHTLAVPGSADAVAAAAGVGYVGGGSGKVTAWDLGSGLLLSEGGVGHPVLDLALQGGYVYALGSAQLTTLQMQGGVLTLTGTTPVSLGLGNSRVSAALDCLLVTHALGYATLDVAADPASPGPPLATSTTQRGWRHAVLDGSGFLLAAAGVNVAPAPGDDHLYLHRLPNCTQPGTFSRRFDTPGIARSVQSYEGLVYVADDTEGLRVVRYVDPDVAGVPPQIKLETDLPATGAEEGSRGILRARVSDDVQVRLVDFRVNGTLVLSDGTFPFEVPFVVPRATQQTSLRLEARAHDTAGNTTDAVALTLPVLEDMTAPAVVAKRPGDGGLVAAGVPATVAVRFSENLDPATLTAMALQVEDDNQTPVAVSSVSWLPTLRTATWTLSHPLPSGRYHAMLARSIADVAGNTLVPVDWTFQAIAGHLVVCHDEWTLSTTGFAAAPSATQFAQNVAAFFTSGAPGHFLIYTDSFGLRNSALKGALTAAGHTVDDDTSQPLTAARLQAYDGVFLASGGPVAPDAQVLADYVTAGGGVYIAGGTGNGGAAAEAALWNPFLGRFGVAFASTYNGIGGTPSVTSTHTVFAGVTSLYYGNGQTLFETASPSLATIVENGLFAVFPN